MNNSFDTDIPSVDLLHNGEKVGFALRTMEEIHARIGNKPDIPHRHDYYTILWASKACGQHFIDYREHLIRPNFIFFVNPGQVHQVITFGEPEGIVIMFTREFLLQNMIDEDFLSNLGLFSDSAETPPLKIEDSSIQKLSPLANSLKETFSSNDAFKMESLGSYLKLFLIECNKIAPTPNSTNTQELQSGRTIIKNFKQLVEQKFTEWHKVALYAQSLNISPDYLNNVVRTTIGKTAKEYIQWRIVLEAKRIGVHTYLTNKEIAYKIGFDDPSHFSKFFKNIHGESFTDFRKSLERSLTS